MQIVLSCRVSGRTGHLQVTLFKGTFSLFFKVVASQLNTTIYLDGLVWVFFLRL